MKRRHPFEASSERRARERGRVLSGSLSFWFRRKYGLAPTDERFLALTLDDIKAEFFAYYYADNPNEIEAVDDEFDLEAELRAAEEDGEGWEDV